MRGRKIQAPALAHHRRLQQLGKLHQQIDAVLGIDRAIGDDHRMFGVDQKPRGFADRARLALRRRHRHEFRNVEFLAEIAQRLLRQAVVQRQHDGRARRRGGDLIGAHERLGEVLRRDRRVVPFGVVAHDGADVLRRMHRRHARRPVRGIEIVAGEHDHGRAVAKRVVDVHGGVHQPDRAVAQRHQRLVGDLVIAVGDADAGFLMGAGEEFRHRVLAVVDQRLMDAAIARCRIGRQVFDVERLDDVDHEIRSGPALARIGRNIRHAGLGGGDMGVRRQRRRQPLLRFRRGRGLGGVDGTARRRRRRPR